MVIKIGDTDARKTKKTIMKKLKFLFLTLTIAMFIVSCENDGGDSVIAIALNESVVPNMAKVGSETIIDFAKLNNDETIFLAFTAGVAQGNPAQTDVIGSYRTLAGSVYTATLFSDVGNSEQEYVLTTNNIVTAFSELNSIADIKLGDVLTVTQRFTLTNGKVLNIINEDGAFDVESNIQATVFLNVIITYPVSCQTMLEGNYISTVIDSNIDIADFRSPQPVTITQTSAGTYVLSDGTADVFGPDRPIGLTFTDTCGTLAVALNSVEYPGRIGFIDLGATLSESGVITMNLKYTVGTAGTCCGFVSTKWTLVLTPV